MYDRTALCCLRGQQLRRGAHALFVVLLIIGGPLICLPDRGRADVMLLWFRAAGTHRQNDGRCISAVV